MNIAQTIAEIDIPWLALTGGMLIGLATALFLLANGRIAGISGIVGGIVGGLMHLSWRDLDWRLAFVLGLVVSALVWQQFFNLPAVQIQASDMMLVIAGVLVGFGTRLGSGCTSGHGVCGIARLSPRSIAATVMFMSTGFAVVYLLRHVIV
ncbi:MAG: YeeE/YedE family protein [Nitrosomonas sp.]|nr:YeeE/YedE family protein [Nitrosomonas sp.]